MNRISASNWYATKNIPKSLHERKTKASPNPDSQNFQTVLAQSAKKADTITFSPSNAAPSAPAPDFEAALAAVYTSPAIWTSTQSETQQTAPAPNTSLRWHTPSADRNKMLQGLSEEEFAVAAAERYEEFKARTQGTTYVPIGRNELPELMAEIEKAVANGESLNAVLQRQVDKHTRGDGSIPGTLSKNGVDAFYIDSNTGEIKHVFPRIRESYGNSEYIQGDEDAVWDLAYDLQMFLRYTFFKNSVDDSDEVDRILAEIKARQDNKCYARFDPPDFITESEEIENADEEAALSEDKDLIDQFIETIGEHQDKLAETAEERYNYYTYDETIKDFQDFKNGFSFSDTEKGVYS